MAIDTVPGLAVRVFLMALVINQVHGRVFKIEAEDFPLGNGRLKDRTGASNGKTLLRGNYDKGTIYQTFCLKDAGDFQILEVRTSNDGRAQDIYEVFVDDMSFGTGESVGNTDFGNFWNTFTSAGPFEKTNLEAGVHVLKIVIRECDMFGMEFDYVIVEVINSDLTEADFRCNVVCVNDDEEAVTSLSTNTDVSKAGITVDIAQSTCPLTSNVKVRFYHNMATSFRLEAIPPNYRTFLTMGLDSLSECTTQSALLWSCTGFTASPELQASDTLCSGNEADPTVEDTGTGSSQLEVLFYLPGPSAGTYLSNIGSKLSMKVAPSTEELEFSLRYKSGGVDVWGDAVLFTLAPATATATWDVPDYSWREGQDNGVQITVPHGTVVESIEMTKREEIGETVQIIWANDAYVIEGVRYDFWWRSPWEMSVHWLTAEADNTEHFDYIRVKATLLPGPDSQKAEIFTLFQDGRLRIVPVPVQGQDSVPFGSYIVLGQPDESSARPNSPIEHVELDVDTLEFKVSFLDGQAELFLIYLQGKTIVDVKFNERFYSTTLDNTPFMLIESRYVDDGMSEIDHVAVDGGVVKHLTDFSQGEMLNGTSFAFYRRCISRLNTQSEGLLVHMLGNE